MIFPSSTLLKQRGYLAGPECDKNESDIFILKSPSLYPQLGVQLLLRSQKNIQAKVKDQNSY